MPVNRQPDSQHSLAQKLLLLHYPEAEAAILMGSQAHQSVLDASRDIDFIVFSSEFRGITLYAHKEAEMTIDFVKIGTHNLSQLLADEAYDTTGTVLHMLFTGEVIFDPEGLAAAAQQRATQLYYSGHKDLDQQVAGIQGRLRHIRKNLARELGTAHDFFLVQDFVQLTSIAHLLAEKGWAHRSVYGINHLLSLPGRFATDLMQLVTSFLADPASYRAAVLRYIDFHLATPYTATIRPQWGDRVVLSVSFTDNSVLGVLIAGLTAILKTPELAATFRYCFWPNPSHALPEAVVLVFDCLQAPSAVNALLCQLEKQRSSNSENAVLSFQLVTPCYPSSLLGREAEQRVLDQLLGSVTKSVWQTVERHGKYDENYFLLLGILLLTLLAKAGNFSLLQAQQVLNYLAKRWRYDERLQGNIDNITMHAIHADLIARDAQYCARNAATNGQVIQMGWFAPETIEMPDWDISRVQQLMQHYLGAISSAQAVPDPLDWGWHALLTSTTPIAEQHQAYAYASCAERLLETLGLSRRQFSIVATALTGSFSHLRATIAVPETSIAS